MKRKAVGKRGDWFATVGNERFPCVHEYWTRGIWPHHADPKVDGRHQWQHFIEEIKTQKKVILTTDFVDEHGIFSGRDKYVALWRIDNVEIRDSTLHFDFVERLYDLK